MGRTFASVAAAACGGARTHACSRADVLTCPRPRAGRGEGGVAAANGDGWECADLSLASSSSSFSTSITSPVTISNVFCKAAVGEEKGGGRQVGR